MMHVIVYDIADERRLRRVASLCEDYGIRVEKSVFECDLDDEQHKRFWHRLTGIVNDESDHVVDYPICQMDRGKIRAIGTRTEWGEGALVL